MKSSGLWNRLNIGQKYAFVSTFIIGVLTHGMMLFNKYSFHDDLICIFQGGATFSSGRWMLFVAEKIKNLIFQDSLYSIPAFNGVFTFFCIAVSSCFLIDLFEIRSKYFSVLLSGIFFMEKMFKKKKQQNFNKNLQSVFQNAKLQCLKVVQL